IKNYTVSDSNFILQSTAICHLHQHPSYMPTRLGLAARGGGRRSRQWLPFIEDIRNVLLENAAEIHGIVLGLRCAGLIPPTVRVGMKFELDWSEIHSLRQTLPLSLFSESGSFPHSL